MSLTPGPRLGVYEITAPIGEGGPASARLVLAMCELWRGLAVALARTRW